MIFFTGAILSGEDLCGLDVGSGRQVIIDGNQLEVNQGQISIIILISIIYPATGIVRPAYSLWQAHVAVEEWFMGNVPLYIPKAVQ